MSFRVRRLLVATPITELLAVAGMLVPSLMQFALLRATVTARLFEMQSTALWSAPVAGFLCCLLGGWWVARGAGVAHERNGVALGSAVAVLDLTLLVVSGAPFGVLMASSPVSRIAGGYCGGMIARQRCGSRTRPASGGQSAAAKCAI
jgi:hypothetical protein